MKSKLKIWGSNTISRGAYSSTGNLTSISCSLSVCRFYAFKQRVGDLWLWEMIYTSGERSNITWGAKEPTIFASQVHLPPSLKRACVYYLCIRIQNPFPYPFFCLKILWFFQLTPSHRHLIPFKWLHNFLYFVFFLHSHTNPSEAQSPAVRPNKNANLIK